MRRILRFLCSIKSGANVADKHSFINRIMSLSLIEQGEKSNDTNKPARRLLPLIMLGFLKKLTGLENEPGINETAPAQISGHVQEPYPEEPASRNGLPDRYTIKETEEGRILSSLEAPNISVHIVKGKSVPGAQARRAPERSIFLDGAAQGQPFMDHERQVYNLDHHEGVERSFTAATCEQAMIVVRKGLQLSEKKWQIWANEPDLDTILAIWILLNHIHLRKGESYVYQCVMPLVRLEGLIDGLGLELQNLTGFPEDLQEETYEKIELLREDEKKIKQEGRWDELDYTRYTYSILRKIDQMFLRPEDFTDFKGLEELARADLSDQNSIIVYRSDMGIYEVEEYLNKTYGKRPGIMLLQKDPRTYTIRKSDLFLPIDMESIYARLNQEDRAVTGSQPENRWGGSGDIGGSPRASGTNLNPAEIVEIIKGAFERPSPLEKTIKVAWALALPLAMTAVAWVALQAGKYLEWFNSIRGPVSNMYPDWFTPVLVVLTGAIFYFMVREKPWIYGIRIPAGRDWLFLLPVALVGLLLGGGWYTQSAGSTDSLYRLLTGLLLLPISIEILFRCVVHGYLIDVFPVQQPGQKWFLSIPVLVSTLTYAIILVFSPLDLSPAFLTGENTDTWVRFAGGLLYGLSAGMIRERSESVWTTVTLHTFVVIALRVF